MLHSVRCVNELLCGTGLALGHCCESNVCQRLPRLPRATSTKIPGQFVLAAPAAGSPLASVQSGTLASGISVSEWNEACSSTSCLMSLNILLCQCACKVSEDCQSPVPQPPRSAGVTGTGQLLRACDINPLEEVRRRWCNTHSHSQQLRPPYLVFSFELGNFLSQLEIGPRGSVL